MVLLYCSVDIKVGVKAAKGETVTVVEAVEEGVPEVQNRKALNREAFYLKVRSLLFGPNSDHHKKLR